ncbi:MAG: D-cysteine desulfhydrase family protein [Kiloniellales bacterium]|nr:D-cysteine desulfhydrase family protein [Kiloniellales bacterium]
MLNLNLSPATAPRSLGSLAALPRARLGHGPTPLESMPNLAAELGDVRLAVKRDDCGGLAFGGNKVRQLEFYLGEALTQAADTILITGAVQSNFVRLAAAAARRLGLDCHIQLEERVPKDDPAYRNSGNVLLDRLLGATLHSYPDGEDEAGADRRLGEIAAALEESGRRPYIIPLGPGHKPLGALGYVVAAQEILTQMAEQGRRLDEIIVPSGSGNTHAGLLFGLRALGSPIAVTGVCVRRPAGAQIPRIRARCDAIAALLGMASQVEDADIALIDRALAPGYGQLNEATTTAMATAARTEGLILDPVYSGKTMAGLIERARAAPKGRSLLFLHTGGTPALFAYETALTEALSA